MNVREGLAALAAYRPGQGPQAMRQRLERQAAAGPDIANGTYYDLRDPGEGAPLHARETFYLAGVVVGDRPAPRVPFDFVVPPAWRLIVAASYGDPAAVGLDLTASTASRSALLGRVCAALDAGTGDEASRAQLTGRLGALRSYARVFGLESASAADLLARLESSTSPVRALAVHVWCHGRPVELLDGAVRRAADERVPLDERAGLVRFVLTDRGRARDAQGDLVATVYRIGVRLERAMEKAADGSLEDAVRRSALNRSLAFGPFLEGDRAGTLAHLELAAHLLDGHRPEEPGRELLLKGYRFPALETLSTTYRAFKAHDRAVDHARRLTDLDPHDARTWLALGKALLAGERAADAEQAFARASECELLQRSKACYFAAVAARVNGDIEGARQWADRCRDLDPAVDGLPDLAGDSGAGRRTDAEKALLASATSARPKSPDALR